MRKITRARAWALGILTLAALAAAVLNGSLSFALGGDEDYADWSQHTAYAESAARAILVDHQLPFWEPMPCGGIPLLANTQSRILTPFFALHLLLPVNFALRLEVLLHSIIGALGAAMLARRLAPGRAGVAAAVLSAFGFAASTAFTLHLAEGHSWMMAGAYTPWALWAFDRSVHERRPWGAACLTGALLALMIGEGGIYPMPQTVLVLAVFALVCAAQRRSARPVACLALAGVAAALLSAPKLLPMMEFMSRRPRLIASGERTPLGEMVAAIFSHEQAIDRPTSAWAWHELGSYLGVAQIGLAFLAIAAGRSRRAPLAWCAGLCAVLAAGEFAPWAPWALLHRLPVFRSMHVPTRFFFPAVVALTVLAACGLRDLVCRFAPPRSRFTLALLAAAVLAADVVLAGWGTLHVRRPPSPWPASAPQDAKWATFRFAPCAYLPEGCGADARYGLAEAVRRRMSFIDAYEPSCPRLDTAWNYGREPGLKGRDEAGYRGEVWAASGSGRVRVVGRTMDATTVDVQADGPTTLVFDQNGDPGWSADVGAVETDEMNRLVWRVPATQGLERHVLRYTPPRFAAGVACFFAGVVLVAFASVRRGVRRHPAREGL